MYYIGGAFTFFPYYIENEELSSISCIATEAAKGLDVVPSSFQGQFGAFVAQVLLAPEFIDDHERGVRQISETKIILFNPSANSFFFQNVRVPMIVQRCNLFVILDPAVYYRSFNTGYNIAKHNKLCWISTARKRKSGT